MQDFGGGGVRKRESACLRVCVHVPGLELPYIMKIFVCAGVREKVCVCVCVCLRVFACVCVCAGP